MAVEYESLAVATALAAIIVGTHFWCLAVANRSISVDSKLRSVNRVFALWHGVGMAATIVVALVIKPDVGGIRWQVAPFGVNQFIAIAWWTRSRAKIRDSEK